MDRRRLSAFANFVGFTDEMGRMNQPITEQRRLSDGPHPSSLRLPNNYLHYPGEFGGSESCVLKEKNSSLSMLLDSTSTIMRTASSTFHTLIGSARRSSYCGEPDPTIQLDSTGQSGSLYLIPLAMANSNESSLSNASNDEQRRTLTIYDGRVPSAPTPPHIPFELMTPIDAITKTIEDPVESFVQIVLEEPEDRPPIIRRLSSSSPRRSSSPRHRRQQSPSDVPPSPKKLTETQSAPVEDLLNSLKFHSEVPEVVQPMDFSFLEAVLSGESAAPPVTRQFSLHNTANSENSSIDLRSPHTVIIREDLSISSSTTTSTTSQSEYSSTNLPLASGRLQVPSSID